MHADAAGADHVDATWGGSISPTSANGPPLAPGPATNAHERRLVRHGVTLHLIGLGLHDAKDVTVKGLERIRSCDVVYAEFYTATLSDPHTGLEKVVGRKIQLLDRLGVEKGGTSIIDEARSKEVALLTAGDPLTATTHTDLVLRTRAAGVSVKIVHAPSIYSAAPGLLGLQHYKLGRTTTLVRPEPGWSPTSPFEAIAENHERGLHTLVLLDIQSDKRYLMTANEAMALLLDLAQRSAADWFTEKTEVGVVARAGSDEPFLATGPLGKLRALDFGPPMHCLLIPGKLHVLEEEAWRSMAA
jgi:diphthine synthase